MRRRKKKKILLFLRVLITFNKLLAYSKKLKTPKQIFGFPMYYNIKIL
jgi:hypothetical protein